MGGLTTSTQPGLVANHAGCREWEMRDSFLTSGCSFAGPSSPIIIKSIIRGRLCDDCRLLYAGYLTNPVTRVTAVASKERGSLETASFHRIRTGKDEHVVSQVPIDWLDRLTALFVSG